MEMSVNSRFRGYYSFFLKAAGPNATFMLPTNLTEYPDEELHLRFPASIAACELMVEDERKAFPYSLVMQVNPFYPRNGRLMAPWSNISPRSEHHQKKR